MTGVDSGGNGRVDFNTADENSQTITIRMDGNFDQGSRLNWRDEAKMKKDGLDQGELEAMGSLANWTNKEGLNLWTGGALNQGDDGIGSHLSIGRGENDADTLIKALLKDGDAYGDKVKFTVTGFDSVQIEIVSKHGSDSDFINFEGSHIAGILDEALNVEIASANTNNGFDRTTAEHIFADYDEAATSNGIRIFSNPLADTDGFEFFDVWGKPLDINPGVNDGVADGLAAFATGGMADGNGVQIVNDGDMDADSTVIFTVLDKGGNTDTLVVSNVPDALIEQSLGMEIEDAFLI